MNKEIQYVIYGFSAVMLILSFFTGDEPIAIFDVIGLAMALGSIYIPGIPGRMVYYLGLGISIITSVIAFVALITLILVLSYVITGVIL